MEKSGIELIVVGEAAFLSAIKGADQAVSGFGTNAEKAGGGVSAFGEMATGALQKVGEIAVDMAGKAAQAIGSFVADSITAAGDFQANMNVFAAVTGDALGASGQSLEDFSQLFIQMGKELPVSTAEVQQAAIELAKGGIDPATIAAGGLRTALDLAAAGGVGLADSATILAKQLGVWVDTSASAADKAAFLTQSANLLAQAANVTTSDVQGMALGLANAGGTAETAGLNFQELVQSMALISPNFASAADAGTSFKTFLSRLQPTTKPAREAMIALGLATKDGTSKFYDAQGSFIGMEAAAALLQGALAPLSDAQREMALQTIFGTDAIRAGSAIAQAGAAGYAAMGAQMAAAGSVAEQAKARQQGFNTALDNAKGSVEALQLTIGGFLLPMLTTLLNDYIAPAINQVTAFADTFFKLAPAILTATDPIATFFDILMIALPQAVPAILQIQGAFDTLVATFAPVIAAAQPLVDLIGDNMDAVFAGLALVIGGVVVGALVAAAGAFLAVAAPIAGLVAAGAALYAAWQSNFLGIQTVTTAVFTAIGGVVSAAMGVLTSFTGPQLATIQTSFTTAWLEIQDTVAIATAMISRVVVSVFGVVATFLSNHSTEITGFLTTAWQEIGQIVTVAARLYATVIVGALKPVVAFIAAHGDTIQAVLSAAWKIISTVIIGVLDLIKGTITATLQIINGDWSGAWNTIKATLSTAVANMIAVISGANDLFIGAMTLIIEGIRSAWGAFANSARSLGSDLINGIIKGIGDSIGALTSAVTGAAQKALDAAKSALGISSPSKEAAKEIGDPFIMGIVMGLEAALPKLNGKVQAISDEMVDTFKGTAEQIEKIIGETFDLLSRGGRSQAGAQRSAAALASGDEAARAATQVQDIQAQIAAAQEASQQAELDTARKIAAIQLDAQGNATDNAAKLQEEQLAAGKDEAERQRKLAEIAASADFADNKAKRIAEVNAEYDARRADHAAKLADLQAKADADAYDAAIKIRDLQDAAWEAQQKAQQDLLDLQERLTRATQQQQQAEALLTREREIQKQAYDAIAQAQQAAQQIADPRAAQRYLDFTTQQILEMANAQKAVAEAQAALNAPGANPVDAALALNAAQANLAAIERAQAIDRAAFQLDEQQQTQAQGANGGLPDSVLQQIVNSLGAIPQELQALVSAVLQTVAAPVGVQAGGLTRTVQPSAVAPGAGVQYGDTNTSFGPMDLRGSNWSRPQLTALMNDVLDSRTRRANGTRSTGGYGGIGGR